MLKTAILALKHVYSQHNTEKYCRILRRSFLLKFVQKANIGKHLGNSCCLKDVDHTREKFKVFKHSIFKFIYSKNQRSYANSMSTLNPLSRLDLQVGRKKLGLYLSPFCCYSSEPATLFSAIIAFWIHFRKLLEKCIHFSKLRTLQL